MNIFCAHVLSFLTTCIVTISSSLKVPDTEPSNSKEWNDQARSTIQKLLEMKDEMKRAKNVILFIGDGMGPTTVTAARVLKGQIKGNSGPEDSLLWDQFRNVALAKTYNTDEQTPDSAGTATAYVGGVKTRSGIIGMDENVVRGDCSTYSDQREVESFLTVGSRGGRSVGVVTTTRITHASPSATYAFSPDRNWESEAEGSCFDIAYQAVHNDHGIDLFLGGGRREFFPTNETDPDQTTEYGRRKDGRNLIEEWKDKQQRIGKKAEFVWQKDQFDRLDLTSTDSVLGLFAHSHLDYDKERNPDKQPSLEEMTDFAIKFLANKGKEGFLLFVEGGRIDHAHHDSLAQLALYDTLALDAAVETALRLTDPKEVLIVVTADHGHVFNYAGYQSRLNPIFHAADKNTATDGFSYSSLLYANGPGHRSRSEETNEEMSHLEYRQMSGVPMNSETHSAVDVAVYAQGPFAHLFRGVIEQNVIPHIIAYAACIDGFGGLSVEELSHCQPKNDSAASKKSGSTTKSNTGLIAAVAIIVILVIVLIFIGCWTLLKKRKSKSKSAMPPVTYSNQALEP